MIDCPPPRPGERGGGGPPARASEEGLGGPAAPRMH